MSQTSIVPVLAGRPAIVKHEDGSIFVSIHDQEFLRTVKKLFTEMNSVHPDKGGRVHTFHDAKSKLACFLAKERDIFYAHINLDPPDWERWQRWADPRDGRQIARWNCSNAGVVEALMDLQM